MRSRVRSRVSASLESLRREFDAQRQALIGRRAPELEGRHRPAWQHVMVAIGGPNEVRHRVRRLVQTSWRLMHFEDVRMRLERAVAIDRIAGVPTRAQLFFGGLDMLRFLFEPGSKTTDAQKGIDLRLHRLLRILGDPVSVLDPGGITSDLEQVLDHITEEFHFNPAYDLQLLETFDGGFPALERRCRAILDGSHPRAILARARVPREDYHRALLSYASIAGQSRDLEPPRFRSDAGPEQRPLMSDDELASFSAAAQVLSSLWGFLGYCHGLPRDPSRLAQRLRDQRAFPERNGEW